MSRGLTLPNPRTAPILRHMALLHVQTTDGKTILVHSSIFDGPVRKVLDREAEWRKVWERLDKTTREDGSAEVVRPIHVFRLLTDRR